MPDSERVQSGILVETSEASVLVDVGSGVLHRLTQCGFNFRALDAVFLTHYHVDHCSDFWSLYQTLWLVQYAKRLPVYGPPGIGEWVEQMRDNVYPYLQGKIEIEPRVLEESSDVSTGDLRIINRRNVHGTVDARVLRIEADGKAFVFSSDTAPCASVKMLAEGADLLAHECNWLDGDHPKEVHSSPSEITEVVRAAKPRRVVLTHVSPEVVAEKQAVIDTVRGTTDSLVAMGEDLMVVEI